HDDTVKRPFGIALGPGSMWRGVSEGDTIITILAASPATARHLATKLCRLLVADQPPEDLVKRIAALWLASVQAPDQIAQVVRAIATSPEFAVSGGAKLKNPFRLMVGYLRGTQMPWAPAGTLIGRLAAMGFKLHSWPAPNGMPDNAAAWSGVN
ncbi:DUF1800 family protein, partial [Enterococcus faecium]|uniref:DUF1800 family protein n=1 Tax=Enterococcus faecium TaxID=1352 RepID=UPI003AAE4A1E